MIALLDVNVLIAVIDQNHPFNPSATEFFKRAMREGWATCPLTENAVLRIMGHANYPGGPGSVEQVRDQFAKYLAAPGHQFWPDDLSLADRQSFPRLPAAMDLTDIYLLALAVKNSGVLVTFDRRIDPSLLPAGLAAYQVLER